MEVRFLTPVTQKLVSGLFSSSVCVNARISRNGIIQQSQLISAVNEISCVSM